jgi:uncharacterized ferritin-like protein (DUF455 family)
MRKIFPADLLARDERFVRLTTEERFGDPRSPASRSGGRGASRLTPARPDAPDAARTLMHGIFVGEVQALEGAGRTCWDFETGDGDEDAPFALKLDMARQCWDEARHTEISCKLMDWMGTELGEFSESTFLYEAACNPDPVLRLTGVNRALEGLAIDVFNTMKEFGDIAGDWLRRLTEKDKDRRERALEFQRVVDKLFSLGGFRGEDEDSPIKLARRFRELAGFDTEEMDDLAEISRQAKRDAEAMRERLASQASA